MNRLSLRRNPLGLLLSLGLWASVCYLLSYLIIGTAAFLLLIFLAAAAGTLSFTIAIVGVPLLAFTAVVIICCATVERLRLRAVYTEPVLGRYRETTGSTWLGWLKIRWTDPVLWRDFAYLAGLYGLLFAPDLLVLSIWVMLLGGITSPAWYAAAKNTCIGYCSTNNTKGFMIGDFPHGPYGPGASGFHIDTLSGALALAAICLVAFLLFNYVVVATARLHATIARALLRPPEDPLREAKEVLHRPGPLHPLNPSIPNGSS